MRLRRRERLRASVLVLVRTTVLSGPLLVPAVHERDALIYLVGFAVSLPVGAAIALSAEHDRRQSFVVDGAPASDDERAAILSALRSGSLPADPPIREATVSYATGKVDTPSDYWTFGVVSGVGALLGLVLAITYSPWCWVLFGVGVVLGPMKILLVRRQGQQARRILDAALR